MFSSAAFAVPTSSECPSCLGNSSCKARIIHLPYPRPRRAAATSIYTISLGSTSSQCTTAAPASSLSNQHAYAVQAGSRSTARMRFSHLQLENWRNFTYVDVGLQQRGFLIGANATGKSNLLDVFRFLRDIVRIGGGFEK